MASRWRRMERPPWWFRIMSLVFAVLLAGQLIGHHRPLDVVQGVLLCGLMLMNAIAPRGMYDGRFETWASTHRLLSSSLVFVFLGLLLLVTLRDFFNIWTSMIISVAVAGVATVFGVWRSQVRRRPAERRTTHESA
jgi:hypothetical protein